MKKKITEGINEYVSSLVTGGLSDPHNVKASRNIMLTNLFSAFSSILFLSLAISAILRNEYIVSIVFFSITFFALINIILLKIFGNAGFSSGFLIVLLNLSAIYALIFGGIDNTGILMAFLLPPILVFLRGSRTGGILLLIMTLITIGILFFVDPTLVLPQYTVPMKVVFVVCFVALSVFSFLHELSREYTEKKLEEAASHDPLTGLLNRREMGRILISENLRTRRYKRPFSLISCDVDNFKKINDEYGHKFGDTVLRMIADIFRGGTRTQECLCRWGGEEFLLLLPETPLEGAKIVAERLRKRIAEEKIVFGREELVVTLSFGVGEFDAAMSIDENIEMLDKAMYKSKKAGKNCVHTVDSL
ncbi:MAG TPA: diguanylate cyclase [bacterium]|nr:diguanylate cyclase [bacterium]HPS29138.1 diguanylate cyclase [bacterium]